ncbi:MAG: T9SS type A sorting domain-containing protein [Bacteroidales bacterium]
MKRIINNQLILFGIILLLLLALQSNAQNYMISFAATGTTTILDSVKVENLTQGTSLTLLGTDILHLGNVGVNDIINNDNKLQITPNPMQGKAELSFYAKKTGNTQLYIYDITGKKTLEFSDKLSQGIQKYNLTGLKQGMYFINISGDNYFYSAKLISLNTVQNETTLEYLGFEKNADFNYKLKSTNATINMAYTIGDNLRFTAFLNNCSNIITDVPTSSKIITFSFTSIIPTLTTSSVTSITSATAYTGGNVTSDGGCIINARGVCWSISPNPTIVNSKTIDGSGIGLFISSITGLTAGTIYYVRSYATNNVGSAYGNEVNFTTLASLPILTTIAATAITSSSAISGGNISSDGGTAITARGICWSLTINPTIADSKTIDGIGTGTFISSVTGLNAGSNYYARAYATNNVGTAYGNQISFLSLTAALATLTTTTASLITSCTASSGGNISNDGGFTITARGVCWSTGITPSILDSKTIDGAGGGSFTSNISGLTGNTTYYVKAYATNSSGTGYGMTMSFTTLAPILASLTTTALTNITPYTASCGGLISSDGGAIITARGVCRSALSNPTIADSITIDGSGTGAFSSSITGLIPGTTYFVRAYATNSIGSSYGNQQSFTAPAILPTLTTVAVSSITGTTATSGGNINYDGGAAITTRGVCWSTSTNPTTANSKTINGTGTGLYSSSITGLTPGITYYIRAYATNSVGTSYGNEVSFTTLAVLPTLITTSLSLITDSSATSGGNITNDGGASITVRGICWSLVSNPTITDNKTNDGIGTGIFISSLTGLMPGSTYYVRAYASNITGTAYGNQLSLISLAILPTLTTTAINTITGTTATGGGNISSNGGGNVTARGVCWSNAPNPTIANTKTTDGTGNGTYSSSITGLTIGANYYLRAYATNSAGTAYGNQVSFTTIALATINSISIDSITYFTAKSGGNILNDGGGLITARGVCWYTSINPTIANSKTIDGTGTGNFISSINGLTQGTTYYLRSYATNIAGIAYGSQLSFTTITATLATLTTSAVSSITSITAISGGNIISENGSMVTNRGVCWSSSANPSIVDSKTIDGTGSGSFSSSITGLTPGYTYYVRAYATNIVGTAYGNQTSFTSLAIIPTVSTNTVSTITHTNATCGGNITNDGGATITSRGVCWNTIVNPTIASNKTIDGSGTGIFSSMITGLDSITTYYVRAYATNSIGTAYGNQVSFTTIIIGDSYQGGKVFCILQSGDSGYIAGQMHGLISATSDQSTGAQWGCWATLIGTSNVVGTGNQNTIKIMNSCPTAGIAARICGDLVMGGYSDWYLPNKNELQLLYYNRLIIGGFSDNYYWTSSEANGNAAPGNAYEMDFSIINYVNIPQKNKTNYVRAIRTF